MISWANREASTEMKLKLFPILILFLIIIPEVVFGGRYGVLFSYVFVDGKNINLELVRQGLNRQKDRQKNRFHLIFY